MLIYSNGCSHTQGHCVGKTYDMIISEALFNPSNSSELIMRKSSKEWFSEYNHVVMLNVVNNIDKDVIYRNANAGKSNNLIFMETYQFVTECIKKNVKIDYIIAQTSGPNRRYHSTDWGAYQEVNPHDNWDLGLKFEPWGTMETIQWVYLLQKLFLEHNIPYVFVPFMEWDSESYYLSPYVDLIDWTKFTVNPLEGHRNDFRQRGNFTCDEAGHPNALGYHHLAELCLSILEPTKHIEDISKYYTEEQLVWAEPEPWRKKFISNFSKELADGAPYQITKLMKFFKKDLE